MNTTHPIELDDAVVYSTPSKQKAAEIVARLRHAVDAGSLEAKATLVRLKFAEAVIKESIEAVMPFAISAVEKHGREGTEILGAELKVKEAGSKYDYSGCNDKVWNDLKAQEEAITEQRKAREKFLQAIQGTQTLVDESTGEVYQVHPAKKSSKTIVETRLKA